MQKDYISIHGPEHHVLDGSCFLTALHNAGLHFIAVTFIFATGIHRSAGRMPGSVDGSRNKKRNIINLLKFIIYEP